MIDNDMYISNPNAWDFSADYGMPGMGQPEVQPEHYIPMKTTKYWNEDIEKTLIILGFVGLTLYVINYSYIV